MSRALDLGDITQSVNIYDVEAGKLIKTHKFSITGGGADGWLPLTLNNPRSLVLSMSNSRQMPQPDDNYGIRSVNPLTGVVLDEIIMQDSEILETFSGIAPNGKIVRRVGEKLYGYGDQLFPEGEVISGINEQYAVSLDRHTERTKLYDLSSDAPKVVVDEGSFCSDLSSADTVSPQDHADQKSSSFSPDGRYVVFGYSVFDTKDKSFKCFAESSEQEALLPVAVDNAGNIYGNDGYAGNGDDYAINFKTGASVKLRNSIDAITKGGFGIVGREYNNSNADYFIPVKD